MTEPTLPLTWSMFPPAINVSTPANPQTFTLQVFLSNTSRSTKNDPGETVTIVNALLLVPVSLPTPAINLTTNDTMAPGVTDTKDWSFVAVDQSGFSGYAQFELSPLSGGALPPDGGVTLSLSGIEVATAPGPASIQLIVNTTAGRWQAPVYSVDLTPPSDTPTFQQPWGVTPTNLQQGQSVVISWTSTGAAYCTIEDDQGRMLLDPNGNDQFPTSGTCLDTPQPPPASEIDFDPQRGRYYQRRYTATAYAAGAAESTQIDLTAFVWLPTALEFTATASPMFQAQAVIAAWSVVNVDPQLGSMTLTVAPNDGSGPYTIAIPASSATGSGIVTPSPQINTTYTLALDNGFGATASSQPQILTSQAQAGWTVLSNPIVSITWSAESLGISLVMFGGRLWCWCVNSAQLYWTADGATWTAVTPNPALPPLDGLIVADLGDGEKLWAFGALPSQLVASSSDGVNWEVKPMASYPARRLANYLNDNGTILVLGGASTNATLSDVWVSADGSTWAQIGDEFPQENMMGLLAQHSVAGFGGNLYAAAIDGQGLPWCYVSSDAGKTWQRQTAPITQASQRFGIPTLEPFGNQLLCLGLQDQNNAQIGLVMDATGAWSQSADLTPPATPGLGSVGLWSVTTGLGLHWLAHTDILSPNPWVVFLSKIPAGTTMTLTAIAKGAAE